MAEKPNETPDAKPTKRAVLKREDAIVLPEGTTLESLKELDEAKLRKLLSARLKEVWTVVAVAEGNLRQAIEAHAGKSGTPDAKPGDYKAPPLRGFLGGETLIRPPEPKVERQALAETGVLAGLAAD